MRSRLSALLVVLAVVLVPAAADSCPGKEELACPDLSTCCRSDSDQQPFICCPYPGAVCCADGRHCCRQGFTCDLTRDSCVRTAPEPGLCPDGRSRCPVDATCCRLSDGGWGCCPYQNAVCCPDMVHCCPQGTVCDESTLTCVQKSQHPMLELAGRESEATRRHLGLVA